MDRVISGYVVDSIGEEHYRGRVQEHEMLDPEGRAHTSWRLIDLRDGHATMIAPRLPLALHLEDGTHRAVIYGKGDGLLWSAGNDVEPSV